MTAYEGAELLKCDTTCPELKRLEKDVEGLATTTREALKDVEVRVRQAEEVQAEQRVYIKQILRAIEDLKASQLTIEQISKIMRTSTNEHNAAWLKVVTAGGNTIETIVKITLGAIIAGLVFYKGG